MRKGPEHWRSGRGWIEQATDKIFYLSQDYFDRLNKVKFSFLLVWKKLFWITCENLEEKLGFTKSTFLQFTFKSFYYLPTHTVVSQFDRVKMSFVAF